MSNTDQNQFDALQNADVSEATSINLSPFLIAIQLLSIRTVSLQSEPP